jgi:3-oxoadipate enol-lactonase
VAARVNVDGVELLFEDTGGEGPAILFLHGLGGSARTWWAQLEACSEAGFRAIAVDQRGAGLSSKPTGPYSVELWAEDVVRFLDALGIERAALIGHSVGCMVAERAAVSLGDRAWALVVVGGAIRWRPEAAPVFSERVKLAKAGRMDEIAETVATTGLSERCRAERPALHGLLLEVIASNDPEAYAEWSAATAPGEMTELDRIECPTLAACGELDPVTPPSFAEAIVREVARGETAVIDGAAHWCQLEAPDALNEALLGFLEPAAPP